MVSLCLHLKADCEHIGLLHDAKGGLSADLMGNGPFLDAQ